MCLLEILDENNNAVPAGKQGRLSLLISIILVSLSFDMILEI